MAGVCGVVDGTELVGAGGVVLQVDGEDWHRELWHDGVEESGLLLWLDGVERRHGEADQTVVGGVLDEGLRDGGCEFDGLLGGSSTADVNRVSADSSSSARAIPV